MNILDVLKKRKERGIFEVNLVGSKDCIAFWDEYVQCIHLNAKLELLGKDADLRYALIDFSQVDTLELVNKNGRLLKRFSKFYKSNHGILLDNQIMGILGDCLQSVMENSTQIFWVDFTDVFDWRDGEFGKSGSCWWGTYALSLPTFQENGGWCVRFWDENKHGIGRTWLFPGRDREYLLGFNSYGVERPKVSKILKGIFLQEGIDLYYRTCSIENSQNSDIPYINDGAGFVLTRVGTLSDESYDLDMEVDNSRQVCSNCREIFDMDIGGGVVNDDYYCQDCLHDSFSFCDRCNEYCDHDNVSAVAGRHNRYDYLCENCASSMDFERCNACGDWAVDTFFMEDSGNSYCEDCVPSHFHCEHCGDSFENSMECPNCETEAEEE